MKSIDPDSGKRPIRQFPSAEAIAEAIAACAKKQDHELAGSFRKESEKHPECDWALLAQIFDFHFKPANPAEPFGPMLVNGDRRSMIPTDLTNSQLDSLQATLASVADPEYQARIRDLLWLRKRNVDAARLAVRSYLDSGARLEDPEHWPPCMERYERAVRLARQVDPKGELPVIALAHLEARVKSYNGADPLFFTRKALEILAEFRFGEFSVLAEIAGRVASNARGGGDFRRARSYFDVQAKLLKLAKNSAGAEAASVASAETYVEEAEAGEAAGSAMVAHSFWQDAIKAFRDRPSLRLRLPELQRRLASAGKQALTEMQAISHEMDIRELVEQSIAEFVDLQLDDALLKFATYNDMIDPDQLRETVTKSVHQHPLQSCFDAAIYDKAGRKIAVRPALMGADEKTQEISIEGFMDQHARLSRGLSVAGVLAPAMRAILGEHEVNAEIVHNLIEESSFIPSGRLPLFAQGIVSGFQWDFASALHLLIPQVENGLRHLVEQSGTVPRNIDANGIEEVWGLERTISNPAITEILGKEFVYELQSLLAGRLGPNLRNSLAHGLLSREALSGDTAFYAFWVIFKLVVTPTPAMHAFVQRH